MVERSVDSGPFDALGSPTQNCPLALLILEREASHGSTFFALLEPNPAADGQRESHAARSLSHDTFIRQLDGRFTAPVVEAVSLCHWLPALRT